MSRSEKIGLVSVVILFALFALGLILTLRPAGNATGGAEDSVLVKQRIQNLQQN